jgi:type IV secretory pathway VirJ component
MTPPTSTSGRRTTRVLAFLILATLLCTSITVVRPLRAQTARGQDDPILSLPLHEAPVGSAGRSLVILITGDGGYASGDRGISDTFVNQGIPVVALDARAYLMKRRQPDEAARDVAHVMEHYLAAWHRDSVVFVGYSRGADMAPFIVTRLPADLLRRVSLVAMVGLADHASFEFHWTDIVRDTRRVTDQAVAPEVMKIHGVRMLCLYGAKEKRSLCPTFPASVMSVEQHAGNHALSGGDGAEVARKILHDLESRGSHPLEP